MSIVEFLRARLDEDEATARAHGESGPMCAGHLSGGHLVGAPLCRVCQRDRTLREVAAKRRIVEACRPDPAMPVDSGRFVAAMVLCTLAAVYADHPDYDPEWSTP